MSGKIAPISSNAWELYLQGRKALDGNLWEVMVDNLDVPPDPAHNALFESHFTPASLVLICGNTPRTFEKTIAVDQFEELYAPFLERGEEWLFYGLDNSLATVGVFIQGHRYRSAMEILDALQQRGMDRQGALRILPSLTQNGCSQAYRMLQTLFEKKSGADFSQRSVILEHAEMPVRAEVKFENSLCTEIEISASWLVVPPWCDCQGCSVETARDAAFFKISTVTRIAAETGHAVVVGTTSPMGRSKKRIS